MYYKDLDYYCKSYSQCLEREKSTTLLVLSFGPVEIAGITAYPTLSSATHATHGITTHDSN
jgi:hypothetical protein